MVVVAMETMDVAVCWLQWYCKASDDGGGGGGATIVVMIRASIHKEVVAVQQWWRWQGRWWSGRGNDDGAMPWRQRP